MMNPNIHLVITSGEPAGVGPEVSYKAAKLFLESHPKAEITLLGDASLFPDEFLKAKVERLHLKHIPLNSPVQYGKTNSKNARYVIRILEEALHGCKEQRYDAIVTAPIQKSVINDAGINFTGHTEFIANYFDIPKVVMMLAGRVSFGKEPHPMMRVALVTTHVPLTKVSKEISRDNVENTIQIVNHDLRKYFGIVNPKIHVSGLNPHAGEQGHLGNEEIESIVPAIARAREQGIFVHGPYPADTMFDPTQLSNVDAYIAMYHDQGLAPFKFACFGNGVNITLGLPIIRTSVDHGTAMDIAGKNCANSHSMYEALETAYFMRVNVNGTSSS